MHGKKFLFWVGASFTLIAPVTLAILFQDPHTTWVAAICGVFVTLLAKFDDLIEFSLGPLKAKMKESIKEATATVEQLRAVAASIAHVTLTDLMSSNFMDGATLGTLLKLHDKLIGTLKELGVTNAQILEAESDWRNGIGVIYHRIIKGEIEGTHRGVALVTPSPQRQALGAKLQDSLDFENWAALSPDRMEKLINADGGMTPAIQEWINDYRHYTRTGEIRREDLFAVG